jgi:hypothetical protein
VLWHDSSSPFELTGQGCSLINPPLFCAWFRRLSLPVVSCRVSAMASQRTPDAPTVPHPPQPCGLVGSERAIAGDAVHFTAELERGWNLTRCTRPQDESNRSCDLLQLLQNPHSVSPIPYGARCPQAVRWRADSAGAIGIYTRAWGRPMYCEVPCRTRPSALSVWKQLTLNGAPFDLRSRCSRPMFSPACCSLTESYRRFSAIFLSHWSVLCSTGTAPGPGPDVAVPLTSKSNEQAGHSCHDARKQPEAICLPLRLFIPRFQVFRQTGADPNSRDRPSGPPEWVALGALKARSSLIHTLVIRTSAHRTGLRKELGR